MATVKAHILGEVGKQLDHAGRSRQVPDDVWDYDKTGAKEPPYNLDALAHFLEINTYHYRAVKCKAIVTAGLGHDLVVPEGVDAPDPSHKAALQAFFDHPNEEMTWGEILENVHLPRACRHDARAEGQEGLCPEARQPERLLQAVRDGPEGGARVRPARQGKATRQAQAAA
jgi:hypothetical protein